MGATDINLRCFCMILSCFCVMIPLGYAQEIQPLPSVQPVEFGATVVLDCEVTGATASTLIGWLHESDIISLGATLAGSSEVFTLEVVEDSQVSTTFHWILTIRNFNPAIFSGRWICNFGSGSTAQSETTELLVIEPAQISFITPRVNDPPLNSDTRLECSATGSPAPTVTWSRSYPAPYILLDGQRRGFVRNVTTNTLSLSPLASDQRGEYRCSVTNGEGSIKMATTYVQLPYAPEVKATLPNIRVVENGQARLVCISQAYPATSSEADVMWLKDGVEVPSEYDVEVSRDSESFYDERYYSRLTINQVTSENVGAYECRFTNIEGVTSATVMLGMEPTIDPNFGAKEDL